MLKGLAITPPILGRISIGKVVEREGKRLPAKDDQFTITSLIQNREGWVLHPLDEALRDDSGEKLRAIPVRCVFNDPELNFRAEYSKFDRGTGRPVCVGNGETCKRVTEEGLKALPCNGPDLCDYAGNKECKPYGRLNVAIGDDDPLGTFVFRTTGFNSIRTLSARLQYFHALSGGKLACMPLELKLRGKSTTQSRGTAIFYVDLTLRSGMTLQKTLQEVRKIAEERSEAGFDQDALDAAAREGLSNGAFEEDGEEGAEVVEEFYPPEEGEGDKGAAEVGIGLDAKPTLAEKLKQKGRGTR